MAKKYGIAWFSMVFATSLMADGKCWQIFDTESRLGSCAGLPRSNAASHLIPALLYSGSSSQIESLGGTNSCPTRPRQRCKVRSGAMPIESHGNGPFSLQAISNAKKIFFLERDDHNKEGQASESFTSCPNTRFTFGHLEPIEHWKGRIKSNFELGI